MARERRKVNMTSIKDPHGITLTKTPANRAGFKVMRSENADEEDHSELPLMAIQMPGDASIEQASEVRERLGLEEYEVVDATEGVVIQKQGSDLTSQDMVSTAIGDGMVALIAASAFSDRGPKPIARSAKDADDCKSPHPVLVQLSFPSQNYPDAKSVCDWLEEKEIDYPEGAVKRTDSGYDIVRHQDQSDAVAVDLGDNVSGIVSRSEKIDVPQTVYRSVVEQVYGYYGSWEFIDFAVAMANPGYNAKSEDALWVLRDVLENIVLYSSLGIEDRKNLIKQATDSYATYMMNLLDSLPTPVITQTRSDTTPLAETEIMSKDAKKTDEQKVARSDDETKTTVAAEDQPVTRGEMKTMLAEALAGKGDTTKRSDDTVDEKTADEKQIDEKAADEDTVKRSDDPMAIIAAALTAIAVTNDTLVKRMDAVETAAKKTDEENDSVTVTRSEEEDTEGEDTAQRSDKDSCYRGMFGKQLQV